MGKKKNLFDEYEDYRLFQEIYGEEDEDSEADEAFGRGCLSIILLVVMALLIQSILG